MHLLILMVLVIAASLLAARMLPDEPGMVHYARWLLNAIAGGGALLLLVTLVIAAFDL